MVRRQKNLEKRMVPLLETGVGGVFVQIAMGVCGFIVNISG